jgi:hypothetical protein
MCQDAAMSYVSLLAPLIATPAADGHAAIAEARGADGEAALHSILAMVQAARVSLQPLAAALRDARPHPSGGDLDTAIILAESLEQARGADHASLLHLAEAGDRAAMRLSPSLGDLVREINRTAVAASADCLEALRDFRWELLARRADAEPSPEAHDCSAGFYRWLGASPVT